MALKRLTIEIPEDSHTHLKVEAAKRGMTIKELVETALAEAGLLHGPSGWVGDESDPGPKIRKAIAEAKGK